MAETVRVQAGYQGVSVCYAGESRNDPDDWANEIKAAKIPGFSTDGFILVGDWARFWDDYYNRWEDYSHCPPAVYDLIKRHSKKASFGGAFIWNMHSILDTLRRNPSQCGPNSDMPGYVKAIKDAMQSKV